MKTKYFIFLLAALPLLITSCYEDDSWWEPQGSSMSPVLVKRDVFEKMISRKDPQTMSEPGKIYAYKSQLLIVDNMKGFQIYDNSNPQLPMPQRFISVPGCVDVSVKDDVYYVNSATDLVALDLSENGVSELSRQREIYHELFPPGFDHLPSQFQKDSRPENTVIIGWENISGGGGDVEILPFEDEVSGGGVR
ncbi:MAG: hypothetical protein Kapaf2KO_19130 [Candidatus Kapaibacteriales bacterium]